MGFTVYSGEQTYLESQNEAIRLDRKWTFEYPNSLGVPFQNQQLNPFHTHLGDNQNRNHRHLFHVRFPPTHIILYLRGNMFRHACHCFFLKHDGIPYGCFLKWWYPTTMCFPTKNDHFGVFWGYQHLRKPPYVSGFPSKQRSIPKTQGQFFGFAGLRLRWEMIFSPSSIGFFSLETSQFSPLKKAPKPKRKVVFQASFFRGYVKLPGCVRWFMRLMLCRSIQIPSDPFP